MPAERATVYGGVRIGLETVPGTRVPTTKRITTLNMMPEAVVPINPFRQEGSKSNITVVREKENSTFPVSGILDFNSICYLLQSLLKKATPITGTYGTLPVRWVWNPDNWEAETPQTYTLQYGNNTAAEEIGYSLINGLTMRFTKTECSVNGDGFGQVLNEGITPTAGATVLPAIAADPDNTSIWVGSTVAGLAQINRALEAEIALTNRWGMVFTQDDRLDSFSSHVEKAPDYSAQLVVEHDSVAVGYMADLRAKTTRYMRIKNIGSLIETGQNYFFQATFAFNFAGPKRADHDGVLGTTFDLIPIFDSTLGGFVEFQVQNILTAL